MRAAFARFDANRSGKLDHNELRAALRQLGLDVGEEATTAILQRHDANNNGLLDVREFGSLVRQLGRPPGAVDLHSQLAGAAWQTAQSDDGRQYFYNDETGESTWKRPAALDAKPRTAARATPRRTADQPPLSPVTVPRASPLPIPCTLHACGARMCRALPRAPCHAPHHAPHATRPMPRTTPRAMWPRHVPRANALQHTRSRCSSPTHTHNAQRTQVLLAVNSVTEVGRQRALAVSGLEMDGTHGAPRSVGGRSGGR